MVELEFGLFNGRERVDFWRAMRLLRWYRTPRAFAKSEVGQDGRYGRKGGIWTRPEF